MNNNNIQELYKNNFSIGTHGYNHYWWEKINKNEQEIEIKKSINYFKKIKVFDKNFSVCYPYGSYNLQTLNLLKKYKIKFALTTRVGSVNKKNIKNVYELPRFDTNDFKQIKMYKQQTQTKLFFEKDAKNWQIKSDVNKNKLLNTVQERNFYVVNQIKN